MEFVRRHYGIWKGASASLVAVKTEIRTRLLTYKSESWAKLLGKSQNKDTDILKDKN